MNALTPAARRVWRDVARAGAVLSAVMLGVGLVGSLTASALPPGSAATGGQTLSVTSGNATTAWKLQLTSPNNVCPGDGLAGYKWSTYMVPAAVDAGTLTYNSLGPIAPSGVTFTQPLFSSTGSPIVAKSPGLGDGLITGTPANYSFSAIATLPVPNGNYKIGYACTKDGQTERYWETSITVSNATASGFDFGAAAAPTTTTTAAPTTTAGTTTTVSGATTTTTSAGATTTTVKATTTTTAATTTTTAAGSGTSTTTTLAGSLSPTTTIKAVTLPGTFPVTGSSSWPLAVWALLLLAFGRIAILLARPLRVLPPKR
jgi:hypothetical protein